MQGCIVLGGGQAASEGFILDGGGVYQANKSINTSSFISLGYEHAVQGAIDFESEQWSREDIDLGVREEARIGIESGSGKATQGCTGLCGSKAAPEGFILGDGEVPQGREFDQLKDTISEESDFSSDDDLSSQVAFV